MSAYLFNKAIRLFALLVCLTAAVGHAEAKSSSYPGGIPKLLGDFAKVGVSEAGDSDDAAIVAVHVAINQAKAAGKPVEQIISSVAFQGPRNNPQPWTKKGGMKQFEHMVAVMTPVYEKFVAGEDYLPGHLEKFRNSMHFDSRPHNDFKKLIGQLGNTCYYAGVLSGKQLADAGKACTASYHKSNMVASTKRHGKTQYAANARHHGKTLVAKNDNKAPKAVSVARDSQVASR